MRATQPRAGFPRPTRHPLAPRRGAGPATDNSIDLDALLGRGAVATFQYRVAGDAMGAAGILDGDILLVDRALRPRHGDMVVAAFRGELICAITDLHRQRLLCASRDQPPIALEGASGAVIEGVVTSSVRRHRCLR